MINEINYLFTFILNKNLLKIQNLQFLYTINLYIQNHSKFIPTQKKLINDFFQIFLQFLLY